MSILQGNTVRLTLFGESHGAAVGAVLEGLPPGKSLDLDQIRRFMARRAPGQNAWSTKRSEPDEPEILSGMLSGRTTGAPLAAIIFNRDVLSGDYEAMRRIPRPGHADYTAFIKYHGRHDIRGGGHFSGRLTAPLCFAGAVCLQLLEPYGVRIAAHADRIAGIADRAADPLTPFPELDAVADRDFPVLDEAAGREMMRAIEAAAAEGDSAGGVIECVIDGLPAGLGGPLFDGLEGRLAQALFAIPAIKGVEFGAGFAAADMKGSTHNDPFRMMGERVCTETNRHGGILGGISSGMPVCFRVAVKPTPTIARTQRSVDLPDRKDTQLAAKGRHDPCIVPRAVPCVEAAAAVQILDLILTERTERKEGEAEK